MSSQLKSMLAAIVCVSLWGFVAVVSRVGQYHLDRFQFLFWVSLISTIGMLVFCYFKGTLSLLKFYSKKQWYQVIGLGFLGGYLYYLLIFNGYAKANGMQVMIIQYTWPMMMSVFSIVLFKESAHWRKVLATILGAIAVFVVITKGSLSGFSVEQPWVLVSVVLGAASFALFNTFMKQMSVEPSSMFVVFFGVATVCSFISMLVSGGVVLPSSDDWPVVIFTGLVLNGFSDLLWLWALRRNEASFLAPFIFFTPVLSTLYLYLIFHDPFLPIYGLGLMLVVIAGLLNSRGILKKSIKKAR
ncbi:DMT family transporter [Parashewanella tropica]|uniref:DMT family transporter n=1 Tax=Parashewanella tropica TaxID=2547970 RepID=UPI00105A3BD7|nr:DMT family transporter [Parashewanella tropica]